MAKKFLAPSLFVALTLVATTAWSTEYGHVISVVPVMRPVTVMQTSCVQQNVTAKPPQSVAGTLIGTVAGALVGSTIGRGNGQLAATAAGAAAGALAGNSIDRAHGQPFTTPVQTCQAVPVTQSTVVGYRTTYEYHGMRYAADVPVDPGKWLALRFDPDTGHPVPAVVVPQPMQVAPPSLVVQAQAPLAGTPAIVAPLVYPRPPVVGTVAVSGGWHN